MILCEKTSFATQKGAQEHLVRIFFEKKKRRISPNREYLCPKCGTWHLSSNGKNDYVYHLKIEQLEKELSELTSKKKAVKIQNNNSSDEELLEKNAKLARKIENEVNTVVKRDKTIEKMNLKMAEYKERFEILRSKKYITDRFFALLSAEKDIEILDGLKKYIDDKMLKIKNEAG